MANMIAQTAKQFIIPHEQDSQHTQEAWVDQYIEDHGLAWWLHVLSKTSRRQDPSSLPQAAFDGVD